MLKLSLKQSFSEPPSLTPPSTGYWLRDVKIKSKTKLFGAIILCRPCVKLRKIVWQNDFSDHFRERIICYEWNKYNIFYATDSLNGGWYGRCCASLSIRLLAGSSGFSLNDGSDLKLLIKLVDAWRFVFGRAGRGWLVDFVCSSVSVFVLPSVSHLRFISVLILDSYVSHDDTMIS